MATYDKGDCIRLSAIWKNISSTVVDPTEVTLKVMGPTGTVTTYTYTSGSVIKDGTGVYHYDYLPTAPGNYLYRWEGTGDAVASGQASFFVEDMFQ